MHISVKGERRIVTFLWSLLGLFIMTAAVGWLPQAPSHEEMFGDTGRVFDWLFSGIHKNGFWWTPAYLMGHSMSVFAVAFISQLFMTLFTWGGFLLGLPLVGLKIYNLLILILAGWGMYRWIGDQTGSPMAGALAAVFYVMGPLITLRTCVLEHSGMATSFIFVPWIFRGIYVLSREKSPREILVLGLCAAGLALSYSKVALLMIPLLLLWALGQWLPGDGRKLGQVSLQWLAALAMAGFLALPFLVPSIRDFRMMAAFLLDPFHGWQESYAYRAPAALIDLWRIILPGASDAIFRNAQNFHFGLIPLAFLFWGLTTQRLAEFRKTRNGRHAVLLTLLGLVGLWFASGPKTILGGLNAFLGGAQGMRDWAFPAALGMFVLQSLMVWICGRELVGRKFAWVLLLVFLFVPGFRIMERLPLFGDIRAPEAYWSVGGYSAWAAAGGVFAGQSLALLPGSRLCLLLFLYLFLDVTPTLRHYFGRGLDPRLFQAYEKVCEQIRQSAQEGRILPLSGRYFYLTLPQKTGMPISTEAAGRHFQLKWIRHMENAGNSSPENLQNYLNVAGVSYIWIDRQDPDTPQDLQQYFQQIFPLTYQDQYFSVLLNPGSLYPAFLANQGALVPDDSYTSAPAFLELSRLHFLAVESGKVPQEKLPVVAASMGKTAGEFELAADFRDRKGDSFVRLTSQTPRLSDYGSMNFEVPSRSSKSWLVICEAYHPDWRAFWKDQSLPVCRAVGGLLAVPIPEEAGTVRLEYRPPVWYEGCYLFGISTWIGCLALIGLGKSGPRGFRFWWNHRIPLEEPPSSRGKKLEKDPPVSSAKIAKILVILPTYNEGETIQRALDEIKAKAPGVDILVVDDNSPDGTAIQVRHVSDFKKSVYLLTRPGKQGLGSAYKEGFQWALQRGYDAVVEMDADLSHDPADVPKLLKALNDGADIAVGSRYLNGVRVLNWPQSRLWVSSFGGWYTRLLTGLPMTDPTSGFKAIRRRVLEGLDWDKFTADGYGFQIEIHFLAWQGGFRLQEVPIVFTERREGQSKMSWQIAREAAWRVVELAVRRIFP